ncbi:MAG: class I SAM-dependent methyltransferase [Proteobacteria bacterium]|nr:class I SAM-dependent methyltransferase [Pseudomonadota bacterium]
MGDLRSKRLLDAGCGDGALVVLAAARGAEAIGVDPDPAMLAAARARADRDAVQATFLDGRVERLPLPDASVDIVCSVTVLCFVRDAAAAVREMARVLRPGGLLVLGELGRWNVWAALRRARGWFGSPTWRAARFRSSGELRALAGQAGLAVTTVRGAIYYPPIAWAARLLAPVDPRLGRLSTWGAAFIALRATKP